MIQCSAVSSPNPGPAGGDIPCRSTIFNVAFALRVSRIITGDFAIKDFPLAEYQRFYKGRTTGIRRVAGAGCRDLQCTGSRALRQAGSPQRSGENHWRKQKSGSTAFILLIIRTSTAPREDHEIASHPPSSADACHPIHPQSLPLHCISP